MVCVGDIRERAVYRRIAGGLSGDRTPGAAPGRDSEPRPARTTGMPAHPLAARDHQLRLLDRLAWLTPPPPPSAWHNATHIRELWGSHAALRDHNPRPGVRRRTRAVEAARSTRRLQRPALRDRGTT